MGLFDKFKRKKEQPAADVAVALRAEPEKPADENRNVSVGPRLSQRESAILVKPWLSEKGTHFASKGRYVFEVNMDANKPEIRKSVEKIYKVHVEDVKIIHLPSKKRRSGRSMGQTSAFKKAVIILRKGDKIPGIIESVG